MKKLKLKKVNCLFCNKEYSMLKQDYVRNKFNICDSCSEILPTQLITKHFMQQVNFAHYHCPSCEKSYQDYITMSNCCNKDCIHCLKHKTLNCPNSNECYILSSKPYFQKR